MKGKRGKEIESRARISGKLFNYRGRRIEHMRRIEIVKSKHTYAWNSNTCLLFIIVLMKSIHPSNKSYQNINFPKVVGKLV